MKQKRMDPYLLAGLILTGVMLLLAIVGAFWTPCSVTATSGGKFEAPSALHLLGTDKLGRDIFSRMLRGLGTTLSISLSAVLIGAGIGSLVGAVTGYFGGVVDEALMRLNDVLNAFPSFLLALTVISILGPQNRFNLILVLGLVFIPSFARVMRTSFASLRDCNYITSARLMGAGSGRILLVHILPNTLRVLLPALTIGFNNAVLAEASMSFLRVTPIETSIGYMLSESQSMFASAPWYALGTGGAIVLLVFGVGLIGEGVLRRNGEAG
ncbi:MAG: ABC transporter permease [Oscillospiraceae bacterium]|nr:ABC transporter permease [Oscillospiraceae bacterium]